MPLHNIAQRKNFKQRSVDRVSQPNFFYPQGDAFLKRVFSELSAAEIDLKHWSIDHLCYRTSTPESYQANKKAFATLGQCLTESEVNGRPISTFKLQRPFRHEGRIIDLVELPAPKPSRPSTDGFEHIEVVCDVTFDELERRFAGQRVDRAGLKKEFNQELEIKFQDCAVKFHQLSLESVVCLEQNTQAYSALIKSNVLNALKEHQPLVAGTFPLGLQTQGSDLDVLLSAHDLAALEDEARSLFGAFECFETTRTQAQNQDTLIIRFKVEDTPFELFAQNTPTIEQRAYKHFQTEEKLLKLGGEPFRKAVFRLREQGLKTEPAFAQLLGLRGDPYLELLKLHSVSEMGLMRLLSNLRHRS